MAASSQFVDSINNQPTQLTDATGTTATTVFTSSAAKGAFLQQLNIATTSALDIDAQLILKRGSVSIVLCYFTVPALAGNAEGIAPVNPIDPAYMPGIREEPNRGMRMQQNDELQIKLPVALAATKVMDVFAEAGDF